MPKKGNRTKKSLKSRSKAKKQAYQRRRVRRRKGQSGK